MTPGSAGERELQNEHGTGARARGFYNHQMLDSLNEHMRAFVGRMEMAFIATADANGEADCSFRAGPPGFVEVLDERTIAYPEYRGNGVMASLGNIRENGQIGILFIDFFGDTIGLHVNGRASLTDNDELLKLPDLPTTLLEQLVHQGGRKPERWVLVKVEEAYIHCSKHIPLLAKADKAIAWGTDSAARKGGDYFKAKHSQRPWEVGPATVCATIAPVDESAPEPLPDQLGRHAGRPKGWWRRLRAGSGGLTSR